MDRETFAITALAQLAVILIFVFLANWVVREFGMPPQYSFIFGYIGGAINWMIYKRINK